MKLWRTTSLFLGMETVQSFATKAENDSYADALRVLDTDVVHKQYYHPILKHWITYTHNRPEK